MNEERIKEFITIELGDIAEPKAFEVEQDKKGNFNVFLRYPGLVYVSKDMLRQEWNQATLCNLEFKEVSLYL